jgi:hypothetical protein
MVGTLGNNVLVVLENKYGTEKNNRKLVSFIYHQYKLVCILIS